jgi:L-ascorbate metabolism protein UlaG (beta-lactamase superfamily)
MRSWLLWASASAIALSVLAVVLLQVWNTMSAKPGGDRLSRMQGSPQWSQGRFANEQPMWMNNRSALLRLFESTPAESPDAPIPVVLDGGKALRSTPASGLRVTWFGHSAVLVEIDGVTVLTDPLWSERASPLSWAGPKRWYPAPVALRELPRIDVVMISHDHYDHLDRSTITAMTNWTTTFVVPLGVGAHLERWGIPAPRIIELDWWQSARVGSLEIIATPARHASGRTSPQSDGTLWAGYALLGAQHRAWYSGDTGFHSALEEIGRRFGPFDVTLIEAGQYDRDWPDWHLGPEQAVEAHRLVRGKRMIPVHWGLLKLAHHGWTEPVERVLAAAQCRGVDVLVPRPGESIEPTRASSTVRWWPQIPWLSARETPIVATRDGVASQRFEVGLISGTSRGRCRA